MIKTFRKNYDASYLDAVQEEDTEMISTTRPILGRFENRDLMRTDLGRLGKFGGFGFTAKPNKQESITSIAEELIQEQEYEQNVRKRTNSFVQNFRNLMEDSQNESRKYTSQEPNIAEEQAKCKNKIIDSIIERYLNEYDIDKHKWADILKDFAKKASESVKPSGFMLDDELDIQILCNEWGTYSDSAYVNGVVIKKNVVDRRSNDAYQNPRILLLSNSLGYVRNDNDFTDFQSTIKQENHFIEIIKEKIGRVNPNIVVVEGDVNKKVSDVFRSEGISVVSNIDAITMKKLERCTQTLIYPSALLLESTTTLGT